MPKVGRIRDVKRKDVTTLKSGKTSTTLLREHTYVNVEEYSKWADSRKLLHYHIQCGV